LEFFYITHHFNKPLTGGEKYNFTLVNALKKRDCKVTIYTDETIPGFFKKNYLFFNFWYLSKINLFRNGILLIDSYLHPRLFIFLCVLKIISNTKVVGTVHHLYWRIQKGKFNKIADRFIESVFISSFDFLIVPSDYTLQSVKKIVFRAPKSYIIHPGIEKLNFNKTAKKINKSVEIKLLYIGGIQERKGLIYLIKALVQLDDKDFKLNLVGDINKEPEYYRQLIEAIEKSQLEQKIEFFGWISQEQKEKLLSTSDIFVFPTLHEGYGIVLIESMISGLPVISTNSTSIPEIIKNNVNGILVPPQNVEKLAQAINILINDPTKREKMSKENLKFIKNINSWNDVENKFLDIISSIENMNI